MDGLAPGGRLLVVDFGDQSGLPPWFGRALRWWLRRFHVRPRADLATAARSVARERGLQAGGVSLYRGYAIYLVVRRAPGP